MSSPANNEVTCHRLIASSTLLLLSIAMAIPIPAHAQGQAKPDPTLALAILDNVSADVQKSYYDPKLHGLDWKTLVQETKAQVVKAPNPSVANLEIAALLERLDDSHTWYIPPGNSIKIDYGWQFKIFGERAFISEVKPGSDAAAKGLQVGDELLKVNGFLVNRGDASRLKYAMHVLVPMSRTELSVRKVSGQTAQLSIDSKAAPPSASSWLADSSWGPHEQRTDRENAWGRERCRYKELSPEVMVLHVPAFIETGSEVDAYFKKARLHKTLIVDLRDTPGGLVDSVIDYLKDIFDHDIKVGDWVERNKTNNISVKSHSKDAFQGDLVVLIDSATASGGEVFARVVQLEHRGTIIGDRSSGKTMESRAFGHAYGFNPVLLYGSSVTVGDTVMSDGKSLEKIGVTPDKLMLPTPADLQSKRDPVLAYAIETAGLKMSPEEAAALFPPLPEPR